MRRAAPGQQQRHHHLGLFLRRRTVLRLGHVLRRAHVKQTGVLNVAPGAKESGIWQADAGPAADGSGNVYLITGNGKFTAASGGRDYGDSVLKIALTPNGLAVRDYFTPADQEHLNDTDGDFGSGSPVLLPDQPAPHSHLLLAAGKSAKLYELDRDNLGHFHAAD